MTRTRHVFGRITFAHDGTYCTVEMTVRGLWLRKKYARRRKQISFPESISIAEGQRLLPLEIVASAKALT